MDEADVFHVVHGLVEISGTSEIQGLVLDFDRAFSKVCTTITALDIYFIVVLEDAVGGNYTLQEEHVTGIVITRSEIHIL